LFNTPASGKSGIVYRAVNNKIKENFKYFMFENGFLKEYKSFVDNPFEYIKYNFHEKEWERKHSSLFISKPPKVKDLYKYKSNPINEDEESMNLFHDFIQGKLTFVNPIGVNDPFDCDCEIPIADTLQLLLYKAILKTKYGTMSAPKVSLELITNAINSILKENQDIDNVSDWEIQKILYTIYNKDEKKEKKVNDEKINLIVDYYRSMVNQVFNLKNEFRILCMANNPKDILMWGYYGNSGKGICCQHYGADIEKAISERKDKICIYGKVKYPDSNQKPQLPLSTADMADNIFQFIVEYTFTKYERWKHEDEFRYVLIGEKFISDYITIDSKVEKYYLGCKNDEVELYKKISWTKNPYKLQKHPKEYELI